MKNLITTLVLTLLLASCATQRVSRQIDDNSLDALSSETLMRYGDKRLEALKAGSNQSLAGLAQCYSDNVEEGLEKLYQITEKNQKNADYWNHVGTCFYLKNEFAKAKLYYELSLTMAKKKTQKATAINNIGLIYLSQRHERIAYDYFQKSLKLNPKVLTTKYNLLQVCIQFSLLKQAHKLSKDLYQQGPKDIDFIHAYATVKNMQGDFIKATELYEQIPEKFLARSDINNSYSLSLFKLGKTDEAQKIMNKRELITRQAKVVSAMRNLESEVKKSREAAR